MKNKSIFKLIGFYYKYKKIMVQKKIAKMEITKEKMEKIEKQAWILILSWSVIFFILLPVSKQIDQKK